MTFIEGKNIHKTFGKKNVLNNVSFSFPSKGFFLIKGSNGAGKSTLLRIIGLLDGHYTGSLTICGHEVSSLKEKDKAGLRKKYFAYLFQGDNDMSFLNSKENSLFRDELWKSEREGDKKESPSQGERVLDYLEAAINSKRKILLLDEPTANLSEKNALKVIERLQFASKDKLVIVVTHDSLFFKEKDKHVLTLQDGLIKEDSYEDKEPCEPTNLPSERRDYKYFLGKKLFFRDFFSFLIVLICSLAFLFTGSTYTNCSSTNIKYEISNLLEIGDEIALSTDRQNVIRGREKEYVLNNNYSFIEEDSFHRLLNSDLDFRIQSGGSYSFYQRISSNAACLIDESMLTTGHRFKGNAILIDGRYLPYVVVDENLSFPIVNIDTYMNYPAEVPFQAYGFMWENPNVDFSSQEGITKTMNDNIKRTIVSPTILKERGYQKSVNIQDDEIFCSDEMRYYLPSSRTRFLDYSNFDFGSAWSLFPDFGSFYASGVNVCYDEEIAYYLHEEEALVSEKQFQAISAKIPWRSVTINIQNPKRDADFIFAQHADMHMHLQIKTYPLKEREERINSLSNCYAAKDVNTARLLPVCCAFFIIEAITVSLLLYRLTENRRGDARLLLSFGYTRNAATKICFVSVVIGSTTSVLIGLGLIPIAISWVYRTLVFFIPDAWTILPFSLDILMKVLLFFFTKKRLFSRL